MRAKTKKKSGPVLAVRYFYANPFTGKEIKGKPSTTVYSPFAQARRALAALNKGHREYLGGLFAKGVILLALSGAVAGCVSTQIRDEALAEFGRTGRAVQPLLREPADGSEKALLRAFDTAVTECEKFGK